MAYNTKTVKRDGSGITPVPQHFNPTADDYEAILGRNGASRVELYGPDGNPISTSSGKLAVRATEIESLLNDIKGKDFATQTTLEAILAKLIATPATEAKQDTLISHVDGMESALASILAKLIDAPATEAKQDALAALIGEVQASPTANTLLARLKSLEDKIDAITDGTSPAVTQLSGSILAKDEVTGDIIELSAAKDEENNYHLTVIDKAPAGYNESKDAIKTLATSNLEVIKVHDTGSTISIANNATLFLLPRGIYEGYTRVRIGINTNYPGTENLFDITIKYYGPTGERLHGVTTPMIYSGYGSHAELEFNVFYPDFSIEITNKTGEDRLIRRYAITGVR